RGREAVGGRLVGGVLRAAGGLHLVHAGLRGAPGIVGGAQRLAIFAGEEGVGELAGLENAHLRLVLGGGVLGLQEAGVERVEGRILEAALAVGIEDVFLELVLGQRSLLFFEP